MDIGVKIRSLRQEKGYSQDYMAFQMGISIKTFRNIENGKSKIDLERLAILTQILEVPFHTLVYEDSNLSFYNSEMDDKFMEFYHDLLKNKEFLIKIFEGRILDFVKRLNM